MRPSDTSQAVNGTIFEDTTFPQPHQGNHSHHYPPIATIEPGDKADSYPIIGNNNKRRLGDSPVAAVEQIAMLFNRLSIGKS